MHRPFGSPVQKASVTPKTQVDIKNEAFAQQKMEATTLKIQAKYGSISPEGQERLTVLQAKMDGLLNFQLEHARRFGHNIANIPLHRPDTPTPIQAKLTIGEPGDKYEQEADETARQVVERIHQPQSEKLQRESLPEEEDELQMKPERRIQPEALPKDDYMQMKVERRIQPEALPKDNYMQMKSMVQRASNGGTAASPDLETSIEQARGGGQPLADSIKSPMEQAFGADFSGVKVYTDTQADQLNQSIQAKAFTTGQDVFFRSGTYEPGSHGGQELLAHELTHVVQQSGSAVQLKDDTSGQAANINPVDTPGILAISNSSPPIQRTKVFIQRVWYEKVGEEIHERPDPKPGGYRAIKVGGKFLKHEGQNVYETIEQRRTHVEKPKSYEELLGPTPDKDAKEEFTINAKLVRFSQDSIAKTFTEGGSIDDTVKSLRSKTLFSSDLPAIRVFMGYNRDTCKMGHVVKLCKQKLYNPYQN